MASNRQYTTIAELLEYSGLTVTDEQITLAEEIIDGYLGFQRKAMPEIITGQVSASTANTITLEIGRHINVFQNNYFLYCWVEIEDGTGVGQRGQIISSTYAGVITIATNWVTPPVSPAHYKIYQLGKIPRLEDSFYDGIHTPVLYYKTIPEAVRRATAAQVQYMVNQGANFFATDATLMKSEHIGDYSYTRSNGALGNLALIAPKAQIYLRGIMNRKGRAEGTLVS